MDVLAGRPYADALEESEAFARTTDEPVLTGQLDSTRGWIALVEGQYPEAFESAMHSAASSAASAAVDLPVAVRAALWARDAPRAQQALDALLATGIHGRVVHAYGHTFEAGVKALSGELDEATASYHEVMREWRDLGAWFELAMCQLDFVRLVGGERPEVRAAADEARSIFERIGARWLVAHLDAALGMPAAT